MPTSLDRYELLRKRRDRFTRMLHGVEAGNDRSLHRARVASRRLRELLPVLQLDAETTHKLARRLKHVTDRFGVVRELDVLLAVVDDLAATGRYSRPALARVALAVGDERRRARARLLTKSTLTELHRVAAKLERIERRLESAGARPPRAASRTWRWAIEARIARRAATLSEAISAAAGVYLPDRLHTVRIAVKKLRYALEVSAETTGGQAPGALNHLRRTQGVLGRLHDLQVLIDRVRQMQASPAPTDLGVWRELDTLVVPLEDECRRLHGRYVRDRGALAELAARLSGRSGGAEGKTEKLRLKRT
ncbi:MAG: CHAD domain-containing protein [Vicinamibacterales bacterium]